MKKVMLIMGVSLLLVGCGNQENTKLNESPTTNQPTTTTTTTMITTTTTEKKQFNLQLNKTYVNNNFGKEEIKLKNNGKVEASACAKDAGCSEYRGTYKIENNTLTISLTEMYDYLDWVKIKDKSTYEIIADNKFKRTYKGKEVVYVLE